MTEFTKKRFSSLTSLFGRKLCWRADTSRKKEALSVQGKAFNMSPKKYSVTEQTDMDLE
jgi:hypothetical protein